jgi:hypothetical protein
MDKNGPSDQRVYYWRPEIRALLCLVSAALAAFFLFGLVAGIDYQINHPESRLPPMGQFFGFAWLVIIDLFLFLTAIAVIRAGRLVLDSEKALLPRMPMGPWGLLKPYELHYSQVVRYGLGMVWQKGQPFSPVLVFDLKSRGGAGPEKRLRLGLRWYDDAAYKAILEEFVLRIGYGPAQLANNWLGDVRFEPPRSEAVCSICGTPLRRGQTEIGLCAHCERKAVGG